MLTDLTGVVVAVIGGDARECILMEELLRLGAAVRAVGYPPLPELDGVVHHDAMDEAVSGCHVVVLPMSSTDEHGRLRAVMEAGRELAVTEALFAGLAPTTTLCVGVAQPILRDWAARHSIRLVELAENDEIAILNSIPTAEGAIHKAMQASDITLHGSSAVVVGFGRCGLTLARALHGLGAHVTVVARDAAQRARAQEMGLRAQPLASLPSLMPAADFLFNTVPVRVVERAALEEAPGSLILIDIAMAPGGIDFDGARQIGLRAYLLSGIPGRVAPRSAGRILARTVPGLIAHMVRERR